MEITGKLLVVVRNGQPGNRVHPRYKPEYPLPIDPSLTELGIRQATRTAQLLTHLFPGRTCTVVSSPFLVCLQTADMIAQTLGSRVLIDWKLCDFIEPLSYGGPVDGLTYELDWFKARTPTEFVEVSANKPEFPEEYQSMATRAIESLKEHEMVDTDMVVIVTHLFLLEAMTAYMSQASKKLTDDGYCAVTIATRQDTSYTMLLLADYTHSPQYN